MSISDSIVAHILPSLAGDMETPILPFSPSGKPGFLVILSQLSPPSNDIYIPDSGPPLSNLQKLLFACQIAVSYTHLTLPTKA